MTKPKNQIDRDVSSIVGSLALEDMIATEHEISVYRQVLSGEIDPDKVMDDIVKNYDDQKKTG